MGYKVKALRKGQNGNRIRQKGDEFEISSESEFGSWMQPIGWIPKEPKEVPKVETVDKAELDKLQANKDAEIAELRKQLDEATKPPAQNKNVK